MNSETLDEELGIVSELDVHRQVWGSANNSNLHPLLTINPEQASQIMNQSTETHT